MLPPEPVPHRNREINLGALRVSRALPIRDRRMVGAWCFLDRFGPLTFGEGKPMEVAPHPHIGLQTVTWLLEGEVLHDDSLGSQAIARPGGVHVMTAGRGIAHAEQTPLRHSGKLNGAQLWLALPDAERHIAPSFDAVERVPILEQRGGIVQVFAGGLANAPAVGKHYSELVGADVQVHPGAALELPLNGAHEHALLTLSGDVELDNQPLAPQMLYYLSTGRASATLSSRKGGRVLLIGGLPFRESILMWWNFVARTPEEIAQARADWEQHSRFGEVTNYRGARLPAPELTRMARPNPMS